MTDMRSGLDEGHAPKLDNDWQVDLREISKGYWRLTITSLFGVILKFEGTDQIALLKKGKAEIALYDKST